MQVPRISGEAGLDQAGRELVGLEQLVAVGPQAIERRLGAVMAQLRAVAEAKGPFDGMVAVYNMRLTSELPLKSWL